MSSVSVRSSSLSSGLTAMLVTLDGQEGMTLPELARVLGVERNTLAMHAKRHSLNMITVSDDVRQELKNQKVVQLNVARVNFLPRGTVEALVKLVNTPQAWAVYNELWVVAKAVHAGNVFSHFNGVITADMMQLFTDSMKALETENTALRATVKQSRDFAATNVLKFGLTSAQIIKKYPGDKLDQTIQQGKAAIDPKRHAFYGDSGFLTVGLREHGIETKTQSKTRKGKADVYDAAVIEKFFT